MNTGKVALINWSERTISSVKVVHKYSDNYVDVLEWGRLFDEDANPNSNKVNPTAVRYNTGALTTGRDWWLVTWTYENDDNVYYTNPENFRGFIDGMEMAGQYGIPVAASAISVAVGAINPAAGIGVAAALTLVTLISEKAMNDASTDGFKQHILCDEDGGDAITEIRIYTNDIVEFNSPSGISKTSFTSKKAIVQG